MSVTARFYVREVTRFATGLIGKDGGWAKPAPVVRVTLSVVSGGRAPENAQWASATPSGEITMTIGNPEAAAFFDEHLGEDMEVVIRPRDPNETAPALEQVVSAAQTE